MRAIAYLLSLVLVFSIPWENAITVSGFGTLTRVIGLVAAGAWLASIVMTGRVRKLHPFHLAVFLFILWNIVSVFWSAGVGDTVGLIRTYIQLAILVWMLWDFYTTPNALNSALQAYILGAYITIGSTISNYLAGVEISAYSPGRFSGAGLNAVDLALILTLGLPVAWHLATSARNGTKSNLLRYINFAYIPLAIFAVLLTASRTALLAIIPAILFIVGTSTQLKPFSRILITIAIVGALFVLQSYIPQPTLDRLATIGSSIAARDLGGRVDLWYGGTALFIKHPLLGVGSGAFDKANEIGSVAHNTFLSVLAELGIIGFLLFFVILVVVVSQAVHHSKWNSLFWLTVLAVWAIGISALTWEFRKPTWLFLSLVVISANLLHPYGGHQHLSTDAQLTKTPISIGSSAN